MTKHINRLRVFAGPNGSGKSTLYNYMTQIKAFHSYYHINPDMIAKDMVISLNLDNWPIDFSFAELDHFLKSSPYQSMNNLYAAFKLSDRAYLFDNSKEKTNGSFNCFAEKNGDQIYISNPNSIPRWFDEFILKQIFIK